MIVSILIHRGGSRHDHCTSYEVRLTSFSLLPTKNDNGPSSNVNNKGMPPLSNRAQRMTLSSPTEMIVLLFAFIIFATVFCGFGGGVESKTCIRCQLRETGQASAVQN